MKAQINEIFHSLQGEGRNAGKPAIFIRFQGCQLRCPWCDTGGALDKNRGNSLSIEDILEYVGQFPCRHIVITGGDPSMQPEALATLAKSLSEKGYSLEMETSGFSPVAPGICKMFSQINVGLKLPEPEQTLPDSYFQSAVEHYLPLDSADFKIVVSKEEDVNLIFNQIEKGLGVPKSRIFLMPQGATKREQEICSLLVINLCKNTGYNFSPRLHIIYGIR